MNNKKILPSEKISNELSELFSNGIQTKEDLLGLILKKSLQKTVQKLLEEEIDKKLQRGYYHRFIRTTNLLERTFEEQKRRTKTIPRFFDEKSCIKLVYGTMIRVSEKWKKIKMTEYELTILRNMRSLFGWDKSKDNGEENFISKNYAA